MIFENSNPVDVGHACSVRFLSHTPTNDTRHEGVIVVVKHESFLYGTQENHSFCPGCYFVNRE